MNEPQHEMDLMRRAVDGDREALTALLERHGPAVRAKLEIPARWRSLLAVDDVMQQTYTDAFLGIREFVPREDGSFAGWLARIASRNLVDVLRTLESRKRGGDRRRVQLAEEGSSLNELSFLLGMTDSTPSRAARREEALAALATAIETLPEAYRRVVELYDLEGRSMEEVAPKMNRSLGAAYMLRSRAHRLLREKLGALTRFISDGG
ncbi:MAG: sigma-70 family RNA polymerase sigma factor [Phycisphaerae bacterium]|nr:MAG: sigma-70 family RNA polymerase sigma factor [Planctomycetota bacterium]KAB2949796.1 MAG: sigma-70 family RNA polymerase sigma factor [Phycisphaerae bacterium]MBE7456998.1 sigma-70 family RNA polymerase sigma factor [Planctomycetia bacterium]MCK6463643.1 RNA polymerase sigma factor [Phycisphaerae bacterium]MCL4718312.1 sigma-70 family RNA polymerase sigma factor [Phycisphaerae bacterium]